MPLSLFDPEGDGYDYVTALAAGLGPDATGHWPSRHPESGQILKGKKHKTFHKAVEADTQLGYEIQKGPDGRYYSLPSAKGLEKLPLVKLLRALGIEKKVAF